MCAGSITSLGVFILGPLPRILICSLGQLSRRCRNLSSHVDYPKMNEAANWSRSRAPCRSSRQVIIALRSFGEAGTAFISTSSSLLRRTGTGPSGAFETSIAAGAMAYVTTKRAE